MIILLVVYKVPDHASILLHFCFQHTFISHTFKTSWTSPCDLASSLQLMWIPTYTVSNSTGRSRNSIVDCILTGQYFNYLLRSVLEAIHACLVSDSLLHP